MAQFPMDEQFDSYDAVTGMDEVGRGCLAGPVVVAAVTWRAENWRHETWFQRLADSKDQTEDTRLDLYPRILSVADRVRVAVISHVVIDTINILRASLLGFERLAPPASEKTPLVIDGNQRPVSLPYALPIIRGDGKVSAIAAAATVAKVIRDELMKEMGEMLPAYGFESHKGYATAKHRQALQSEGPSRYHRKSFNPVRDQLAQHTVSDDMYLQRLAGSEDVGQLWSSFMENYTQFSLSGARTLVQQFKQKGIHILPQLEI